MPPLLELPSSVAVAGAELAISAVFVLGRVGVGLGTGMSAQLWGVGEP